MKVLDLTRHLAGPYATMMLGDLGADVIKVERSKVGDDTRHFDPVVDGESTYFFSANRNKRSLSLDLSRPTAREIIKKLSRDADVVIHNFKPGTMERWGLDYDTLSADNEGLIFCDISAVGVNGPDSTRSGVDILMQAYGGLMSITGDEGGAPIRTGMSLADLTTGSNAAQAVTAALYSRTQTGKGQRVQVSLLDGQVSWLSYYASAYLNAGVMPKKMGSHHPSLAPYGAYQASDEWLIIAIATSTSWQKFCEIVEPSLLDDPRFASNPLRVKNKDALDELLNEYLLRETASEWASRMVSVGIPASPVQSIDTVLTLPQVLHQDMVITIPRENASDIRLPGIPIKMLGTPGSVRLPPPALGEHTDQVLLEAGYSQAEIDALREDAIF
ncbi:CaiB/BaiF CoA-transferase family protein [Microbacterium esteraromaticum]|uniref:CaiB/BaiF CoA transferase family protein n=1 Tax=Microbacterium esteraromaticum TaxID=57043 RepID=UPI001C966BA5|nr:CoA transferase [Microbacterium esteraromaticum]MBY6062394.1 CoA transferase [Microbacterium esteraromaticum]